VPKLEFEQDMQCQVLGFLIYSKTFTSTFRDLVQPDDFTAEEHWTLCSIAYDFFDKYGTEPGVLMHQYLINYCKQHRIEGAKRELLMAALNACTRISADKEAAVESEVLRFVLHSRVRKTLEDFIPEFNRGEYSLDDLIYELRRAVEIQDGESEGHYWRATIDQRIARRLAQRNVFQPIATLIPPLDARFNGIQCSEIGTIMSASGGGKTRLLAHLGKAALTQARRVLHVTLEMSAEQIDTIYDQAVVGEPKERLTSPSVMKKLKRCVLHYPNDAELYVTFRPAGTRVSELRRVMDKLRERDGFVADLLVIDYGELLTPEKAYTSRYDAQGAVWRELKTLAIQTNTAIWTGTQSNRKGVGAERMTEMEVSDSYEKIRASDVVLGFNRNGMYDHKKQQWQEQDDAALDAKTVRLHVIKNREGSDKYDIEFGCDLERGIFFSHDVTAQIEAKRQLEAETI
jgi:replicative DNA helicase